MTTCWLVEQRWERMLFAHWRVEAESLARVLPPGVEPDVGFGSAWIGIVAFVMTGTRAALPPHGPALPPIPELNVRTYVRVGGVPGVWFLTLDATSPFFVNVGRVLYGLRYRRARMVAIPDGETTHYASAAGPATFSAHYRPVGPACAPQQGSLEHFLVERYRFFAERHGRLITAEVAHEPWRLERGQAEIALNGMAPPGLRLEGEPLVHCSNGVAARISAPVSIRRLQLVPLGHSEGNQRKETHEHSHDRDHRRDRPAGPRLLRPRADGPLKP